jgi:hypothetical protein
VQFHISIMLVFHVWVTETEETPLGTQDSVDCLS